jgi:hypothetical protein
MPRVVTQASDETRPTRIPMASRPDSRPATREAQVLDRLITARGIGQYGLFFVRGEGEFFPNGVEESSGFVVDGQGRVYSFWTGWDEARQEVHFSTWEQVEPEPEWLEDEQSLQAREAVGLDTPAAWPAHQPALSDARARDQGQALTH